MHIVQGLLGALRNEEVEAVEGSNTKFVLRHTKDSSQNIDIEMLVQDEDDFKFVEWEGERLPKTVELELRSKKFEVAVNYPLACLNTAFN